MKFLKIAFLCALLNICLAQVIGNGRKVTVQNLCSFPVYVGDMVEFFNITSDSVLIKTKQYHQISYALSTQEEVSLNYTVGQLVNVYVSQDPISPSDPLPDGTSALFSLDLLTAINGNYVGDFYYLESSTNTTIFAMVVPEAPCPAKMCSSYPGYPCSDMLYVAKWQNYTAVPTQCNSPSYTLVFCHENSRPIIIQESDLTQASESFLS